MTEPPAVRTGGSIYAASVTGGAAASPVALVTSAGPDENNYYPAVSPDDSGVIFNRATSTTLATHDSYNNPNAKLFAIMAAGGTPVELAKANAKDGVTNSWPRWSPFVQMYQGKRIVWVTFSSTRDYGLRVHNEGAQFFNCYPPVSRACSSAPRHEAAWRPAGFSVDLDRRGVRAPHRRPGRTFRGVT